MSVLDKSTNPVSAPVDDTTGASTGTTTNPVSESVDIEPLGPDETMGEPRRLNVRDSSRIVAFTGVRLGNISSERPDSLRWTELSIYRTTTNLYIAHRVGISCVAHNVDCDVIRGKNLPSVLAMKNDEFKIEDREPCPVCRPDIIESARRDPLSVRGETDRHWAGVCQDAPSLLNALHTMRNGARSLSGLASAVLNMAAENDEQIAAAMAVPIEY